MSNGIDETYSAAADLTGRTVPSLHQTAIAVFASMLHHGMKGRNPTGPDKVIWTALAFDCAGVSGVVSTDFSVEVNVPRRSEVAEKKITVTMHQVLKSAKDDPGGKITPTDNGVLTALIRRGLARYEHPHIVITDAGSFAVDHAPLDPRSQPSGMSRPAFDAYLQNRGAD